MTIATKFNFEINTLQVISICSEGSEKLIITAKLNLKTKAAKAAKAPKTVKAPKVVRTSLP